MGYLDAGWLLMVVCYGRCNHVGYLDAGWLMVDGGMTGVLMLFGC